MAIMAPVFQVVLAALGALGFAFLYEIRGRKLIPEALGGAFGWGIYLAVKAAGGGDFWGLIAGSFGVAILSEVLARKLERPVTLLLVPMLIPMIPGGGLYTAVYDFVSRNYDTLGKNATHVLTEAFAIAIGILLASYVAKTVIRLRNRIDSVH